MRNSAAFIEYQLRMAILQGTWMLEPRWVESHLPMVVQLLQGGTPWADATRLTPEASTGGEGLFGSVEQLDNVRVIDLRGALTKYGGWCSYGTLDYIQMVEEAYNDPQVEALLFRVDCPGGQTSSMMALHDIVANKAKPVVTWIEDMWASAAVMALSGSDYVMASQPMTMVGSIGTYTRWMDYSAYMKEMGFKEIEVYSRLSKHKNIESREAAAGNLAPLEDFLDEITTAFIETVKADRAGKVNLDNKALFQGRTFFAKDAIGPQNGLIDDIGPFDVAFEKAQQLARERRPGMGAVYFTKSQTNEKEMFGDKHPKLSALRGIAPEAVTEEQINAINAVLTEQGIAGAQLVHSQWVLDAQALEKEASQAKKTVTDLTAQLQGLEESVIALTQEKKTLSASVMALTQERDDARAKAEAYGKQPGATPAALDKKEPEAKEKIGDTNTHAFFCEADAELAAIKAAAQLN